MFRGLEQKSCISVGDDDIAHVNVTGAPLRPRFVRGFRSAVAKFDEVEERQHQSGQKRNANAGSSCEQAEHEQRGRAK